MTMKKSPHWNKEITIKISDLAPIMEPRSRREREFCMYQLLKTLEKSGQEVFFNDTK